MKSRPLPLLCLLFLILPTLASADTPTLGEKTVLSRLPEETYEVTTIRLWPDGAPDEPRPLKPEEEVMEGERGGDRILWVTQPSMIVARPRNLEGPVPAVFVCPGGGYGSLGVDSGGVDIIHWLKDHGIAGVYMKYRVPKRHQGYEMHYHPLQDIQRAMSLLRSQAGDLGIDPEKIGVIGFSAGGNLAAMLGTHHTPEDRIYEPIDAADQVSCRPDFVATVAAAYLTDPILSDSLRPELNVDGIARNITPPTFITSAVGDKFTVGSLHYFLALRDRRVPAEAHIYEQGGHAEGIHEGPNNQWPEMFADWLKRIGIITPVEGQQP